MRHRALRLVVASLLLASLVAHADDAAFEAHRARIESDAFRSGDLRLRVLFSITTAEFKGGPRIRERVPLHELIESARGSTDPLVLQLLLDRCRIASRWDPTCDEIDLARRWVQADTQNQIAWIALATVLEAAADALGAEAAWQRAGQASLYRDGHSAVLRALVRALPAESEAALRYRDLIHALVVAANVPIGLAQVTTRSCQVPTRREACMRIGDVASRDADNMTGLLVAKTLARDTGGSDELVTTRDERMRALQWALGTRWSSLPFDRLEAGDPATLATANRLLEEIVLRGEVVVAEEYLASRRISHAEAARRRASPAELVHPS